jgi:nucleoside-diphosphate-sugar epimerase
MVADRPAPAIPGNVFITGANGFIGRALASRLRELGAEVRGVDLRPDPANGVVAGTTTDPAPWASELEGVDTVIHTAAVVSTVAPLDQAWEVNVMGTHAVLRAAAAAGVRRFVHVSSIAAYGFYPPEEVGEDYPLRTSGGLSSYTDTKLNSEHVVLAAHAAGEIECVVIRPADVYGPGSVFIREPIALAKAGQMILPNGGRGTFDVIYIDNFIDAMVLVLASDQVAGQIINIGEGHAVTCMDFFGRVAQMAGGKVRTVPITVAAPVLDLVGGLQRRLGRPNELGAATMYLLNRPGVVSIDKARALLGYEPIVSYEEGMRRSEVWARAEGLL